MYIYLGAAILAFVALIIFILISDRKVLFYNAAFFIFVLIANLGYLFVAGSSNVEEAVVAFKFTYFGGCGLSLFLMMLVCDACKINLPKFARIAMYGLNCTVMALAMTIGYTDWFYKKCDIEKLNGISVLVKEYGPCHNIFLVMLYGYMVAGIIMLIYSLIRRKKLVYKNIFLLLSLYVFTVLCYTVGRKIFREIDPVCISYCIDVVILLFVTYNTFLYNLDEALLTSVEKQEFQGYLMFDMKYNFVGCNSVAIKFIPELARQSLARKLNVGSNMVLAKILEMIAKYEGNGIKESITYEGQDLEISVQYMYKVNRVRGYIVQIADDSKQQGYIRQINAISANKSNFLSNVSHEIRTPINAVLGMNEMILRECEDERITEYAENIEASGHVLLQLINDVLDLSKIESGKFDVLPVEYQMADVINDLEMMIRPLVNKKPSIEFTIEAARDLPQTLFGDANRIKQMVTNILTNAVKYTESGYINFKIGGVRTNDDEYVFQYSVTDTGRGISEENIDNLFNAFERVDQYKNSGIEGTGLGLAITKKFAVMMGGDISVRSTYGEGSTFTITVPQKVIGDDLMGDYRANRHRSERVEYQESFHAPNARILVVDDVEMNLMVIRLLLKKTQMQIECVKSGVECIEAVKKEHFDVILLDHMMPGMDGIDTLNALREAHLCDTTPVVALTANVDINSEETYRSYGFDGYLPKPVPPAKLEALLKSMIATE